MSDQPLLPIDEALRLVLLHTSALPAATVPLQQARGWIAQDLHADLDQPPFDRSAMDGFALNSQDAAELPARLQCVGVALAGAPWSGPAQPGTCVRIMTGAVVPAGLDAVVPVEQARVTAGDQTWVELTQPVRPEQHIARQGCEVRVGDRVLAAGQAWTPARQGVAAAFGHATVASHPRPRVAIVPTGDELVAIAATPGPGQIRDSNRYTIAALLERHGADVQHFPAAPDDRDGLRDALSRAWAACDVLITCGGVSAGDLDLVAPVLAELGAEARFHKIAIKPGKPLLFATRGAQIAIGLPGNPVSALVCATLFVLPALARMSGAPNPQWQTIAVPLAVALGPVASRAEVVPARWVRTATGVTVRPTATKGSADLPAFAQADCLILRRAAHPSQQPGDLAEVLWWPGE